MLAFLPYPRHLFDADVDALFSPCPSPHGCRARPGAARGVLAPSGSMQLTREGDCYVVSAALPGVRPDEISCVEVVGNRTVRLEVTKKRPRAAPAAPKAPAPKAPAPDTTAPSSDADEAVVVEDPASTAATIDSAAAEEPLEAIVVLDQTLALPQPVDTAGITCTYQNGLLRIQVPIVAPALGDDHRELMAALEQEAKDAETKVVELAQQLKEQQTKAREAQQALHSAKIGVHRACQTRRHALAIA